MIKFLLVIKKYLRKTFTALLNWPLFNYMINYMIGKENGSPFEFALNCFLYKEPVVNILTSLELKKGFRRRLLDFNYIDPRAIRSDWITDVYGRTSADFAEMWYLFFEDSASICYMLITNKKKSILDIFKNSHFIVVARRVDGWVICSNNECIELSTLKDFMTSTFLLEIKDSEGNCGVKDIMDFYNDNISKESLVWSTYKKNV